MVVWFTGSFLLFVNLRCQASTSPPNRSKPTCNASAALRCYGGLGCVLGLSPFPLEYCTGSPGRLATEGTTERIEPGAPDKEGIVLRRWRAAVVVLMAGRRSMLLLACDISAEQEEPWRRLLQELSDAGRKEKEEYVESRRRLGISVELVWLVPTKPSGGGMAVVYLEAEDPERVLRELAASDAPVDSGYGTQMRKLFGFDPARLGRAASGELLYAWRDDARGEPEASKRT